MPIQTVTGKLFDPLKPDPESIDIEDIAYALSLLCRFNGHCLRFYSVAEHCVHVANHVDAKYRLRALLHDAAEAYLGDIPSPVKQHLPDFKRLEKRVHKAICGRFGIKSKVPKQVKAADRLLLGCERREGMLYIEDGWGDIGLGTEKITPQFWSPETAKQAFLETFWDCYRDTPRESIVAGLDGTKQGWIMALWQGPGMPVSIHSIDSIAELDAFRKDLKAIAIDMPIGLLDQAQKGGRHCEIETRKLISRKSSVFSSPVRDVLEAKNYEEACKINRESSQDAIGLTKQTYNILSKISEVNRYAKQCSQKKIYEAHPELSFHLMSSGTVQASKKSPEGRNERLRALKAAGFLEVDGLLDQCKQHNAQADDLLDALAAAWSAWRIHHNKAIRLPEQAVSDGTGLDMAIWG